MIDDVVIIFDDMHCHAFDDIDMLLDDIVMLLDDIVIVYDDIVNIFDDFVIVFDDVVILSADIIIAYKLWWLWYHHPSHDHDPHRNIRIIITYNDFLIPLMIKVVTEISS